MRASADPRSRFKPRFKGFPVVSYDIDGGALTAARDRFDKVVTTYATDVSGADDGSAARTLNRLTLKTDLAEAAAGTESSRPSRRS